MDPGADLFKGVSAARRAIKIGFRRVIDSRVSQNTFFSCTRKRETNTSGNPWVDNNTGLIHRDLGRPYFN